MTRKLIVSREARADIAEAVAWFRDRSPSLPARFGLELDAAYSSILEHPEMYPLVYRNFRRNLLQRFPYSIFYVVEPSSVLIVGVVHQARDESTWKRRS
ncbi:MAG TPA: type II toxin-antitoxin system RelE/ParE family toxin [Thermoanaerobaculia bacterium]|nr:type II toxin-antitoxin system RelE/ParE family toxin [Thermoanaerobaculia bacterium]